MTEKTGEELKREGQDLVALNSNGWTDRVQEVIVSVGRRLSNFTADDVQEEVARTGFPSPHDVNCFGSAMGKAARRKTIVGTDLPHRKSCRPKAHSRALKVWRLA